MRRLLPAFAFACLLPGIAPAFDVMALVDHLDYSTVYDIETERGIRETLEYVLKAPVTSVWWRDKGGGLVRYPSREEAGTSAETPVSKYRLPNGEACSGYLRLDRQEADSMRLVFDECRKRGVGYGIHTTLEENHWLSAFVSGWNLEHPRFWSVDRGGIPWCGHCSLAWPEVRAHKLAMVDERLAFRPQTVFFDAYRRGGWSPRREFVTPVLSEWSRRYGTEKPSEEDPRWLGLVSEYLMSYLRAFAGKCHAQGCRFSLGLHQFDGDGDSAIWRDLAIDWKALVLDGTVDDLVVMGVRFDRRDPWGSTRSIYAKIKAGLGRARVYFPVAAYDYMQCGIGAYARLTKEPEPDVARRLVELAREFGGAGVVLECLDYGNYSHETLEAIRVAASCSAR